MNIHIDGKKLQMETERAIEQDERETEEAFRRFVALTVLFALTVLACAVWR